MPGGDDFIRSQRVKPEAMACFSLFDCEVNMQESKKGRTPFKTESGGKSYRRFVLCDFRDQYRIISHPAGKAVGKILVLFGTLTLVNPVQPENATKLISVTLFGIVILGRIF